MLALTLSCGVHLIEPLKDIRDHEGCSPRRAVLPGDVGLLSETCSHVVNNGYDNAYGVLRPSLGQLQL